MRIGDYEIQTVNVGRILLDGGAMFGVVPKVLWQKTSPADEKNRITIALRLLLIRGNGRIILVDNGVGDKLEEKLQRIYGIDSPPKVLQNSLNQVGLNCSDVTDVILTHLHFDHVGGSTFYDHNGELVPTFRNAVYYVQQAQFDWAQNPSERDRASYLPENFLPLQHTGQLQLLQGEQELFPGIEILVTNGHTFGQSLIKISDNSKTLLHCADLIPLASQLSLTWIMSYDLQPLLTLEEKKRILSRAVLENWILFYEHDLIHVASTVIKGEKGYQIGEEVAI